MTTQSIGRNILENSSSRIIERGIPLGVIITIAGICALIFGFVWMREDIKRKNSLVTTGYLQSAKIEKVNRARLYIEARRSDPLREPQYQYDTVWTIVVEYEYSVDGQKYYGDRTTSSREVEVIENESQQPSVRLNTLLSTLKPGNPIQVYYNASDPEDSFLVFVSNPNIQRAYLIGSFCLLLGLVFTGFCLAFRTK
jgi:hypothetical protein